MTRPTELPEWATDGDVLEPSNGKKQLGFLPGERPPAQWFNWLHAFTAEWLRYLDAEKLPEIVHPSAGAPTLGVSSTAHDDPDNPDNQWKNVLEMRLPGQWVRLFSGDNTSGTGGVWALTWNAKWNVAAGGQHWDKDDPDEPSYALLANADGLNVLQRGAGAGIWTDWTPTQGDINVGGDLWVGGEVDVDGGAQFGASVETGGAFNYITKQPRITILPHQLGMGTSGVNLTTAAGSLTLPPNSRVEFPLRLPEGAEIGVINVPVGVSGTANWTVAIYKLYADFFTPAFGAQDPIGASSGTVNTVDSPDLASADGGGESVQDDTVYYVSIGNDASSANNLLVGSVQVNWMDPGPRN